MIALWITATVGWTFGFAMLTLWIGERGRRKYIENVQLYGGPRALKKASFYHPEDPEERIERAIDQANGQTEKVRLVREEDAPPAFDRQTIENGVQYLLEDARLRGIQLSVEEARDEAIRMLNAEGPEMA